MEVNNIFTNKMNNFSIVVTSPVIFNPLSVIFTITVGRRNIPNRRIKPDIEKLIFCIRDFKPEIRTITGDTPLLEPTK
jgi:hypothetical protein